MRKTKAVQGEFLHGFFDFLLCKAPTKKCAPIVKVGAIFCCILRGNVIYYRKGGETMQNKMAIRTKEEYKAYVLHALEEAEQEAANPNTKWISEEDFLEWAEEWIYALENRYAAKSA